jgi:hypothetical protein
MTLKVDDIITPEKIISLAQNCLSERRNCGVYLQPDRNIFFVKTDYLNEFSNRYLPHISYNFTLITHDSDNPINEQYFHILKHPLLKKWFAMNCHILHDKLQPIPIGIANECWPHGDKQSLLDIANSETSKENLLYSNFNKDTNINDRQNVNQIIKNIKGLYIDPEKRSYKNYLQIVKKHKFIISPPGNSTDCHRIWESIYIGTIPIVLKSVPMVFFKDLPILFINQWNDLYSLDLEEKYNKLIDKSNEKSKFGFYRKLILETTNT